MTFDSDEGVDEVGFGATGDVRFLAVNDQSFALDDASCRLRIIRFGKAKAAALFAREQGGEMR